MCRRPAATTQSPGGQKTVLTGRRTAGWHPGPPHRGGWGGGEWGAMEGRTGRGGGGGRTKVDGDWARDGRGGERGGISAKQNRLKQIYWK